MSTTRPERPALRARYDRRQREVVVAAARVFAERGYDQTTVQDLADAIGLAAGGLYHYFGSKEQLLISICDELMEPLLAQTEELLAADDAGDAEARLRAVVHLWVAHVVEHRHHMLVFQQERHVIERGAQWKGVRDSRKRFERLVGELLDEALGAGTTPDRRLVLSALLGMVNHTAQWFRPGRLSPEEIADGYADLVLSP